MSCLQYKKCCQVDQQQFFTQKPGIGKTLKGNNISHEIF